MSNFDYSLFQTINHLAVSDSFLNSFMEIIAQRAEYLFFAAIIFYWFYKKPTNRQMVVEAVLAACVAMLINMVIGLAFYRDRPFVAHHVHLLISHAKNASFPSDHATAAFVIATTIWMWRKRDGWLWLVLAAVVAFSRVWTGVHYPLDVIGGMFIGVTIAFVTHRFLTRLKFINRPLNYLIEQYEKAENKIMNKTNTM
ncbi:undecaprenyl-diphosphatase [Neobacillus ginsengisoli]|uniref:Undecaprenyl-diphosphatase n=1 Tax=Neobacillus ginsengisoli TaxID=904295 RepID=A0ABT9XVS4_9BACI|nr:undecaprenyl-diphosphatase [Neobacillus ginsengisoli]MDQ0199670.1 undecaprenyl-diphosphatase [Neobacillus ginsengisoli]